MIHDSPAALADKIRLQDRIGAGGSATIYRATDLQRGQPVAVKVLRPEHAADTTLVSLFEREGEVASSIAHPNVVKIHSHGVEAETHYIVMELVQGISLRRRLTLTGPLPIPEALRILHAVLRGLEAIHDAGFIHRDIKPQNILLAANGVPKIIDFGIVLPLGAPSHDVDGVALGTAAYIAPEQAAGQDLGPQADLYAAGAVLFELLTGQAPFPGSDPIAVMNRHLFEPPRDPRSLNPAISPALATIILRALAKDPAARFSSAAQMRHALDLLSPDVGQQAPTSRLMASEDLAWTVPVAISRRFPNRLLGMPALTTFVSALLLVVLIIVLMLALVSAAVTANGSPGSISSSGPPSGFAGRQGGQASPTIPNWTVQAAFPDSKAAATVGSARSASVVTPTPTAGPSPTPAPEATPQSAPEVVDVSSTVKTPVSVSDNEGSARDTASGHRRDGHDNRDSGARTDRADAGTAAPQSMSVAGTTTTDQENSSKSKKPGKADKFPKAGAGPSDGQTSGQSGSGGSAGGSGDGHGRGHGANQHHG